MKYYSEITGELFDTIEELKAEEERINNKKAEEERAQKEIDAAYEEAVDAWNRYIDLSRKNGRTKAYLPDSIFNELINEFFGS